ncbi:MAG TPA: hypothetical protein VLL75_01795 [Vicinamibacteria bacterium]|nr:hypothetical protein [Vicinamibacteria bacterium]
MGRIVDLCGEVAAAADEGAEGLILPPEAWDRLREDWSEEDIEDAMSFVKDSLLQTELVEAADSLSSTLVELLGVLGSAAAFAKVQAGEARWTIDTLVRLARRVARLEEALVGFRDTPRPDNRGFAALQERLMDLGIEKEMWGEADDEAEEDKRN